MRVLDKVMFPGVLLGRGGKETKEDLNVVCKQLNSETETLKGSG
jgi:hypothetical protein